MVECWVGGVGGDVAGELGFETFVGGKECRGYCQPRLGGEPDITREFREALNERREVEAWNL